MLSNNVSYQETFICALSLEKGLWKLWWQEYKNREGAKTRCTFFILLSVPSKFKHKRVEHILNYQMFETLTMIGNDECRFSSCLVSGIIFCWLSCIAENRLLTNLQVITYQTGILRWHITWLYVCGLCTGNFCPMHFSFASLILPYLHTLTMGEVKNCILLLSLTTWAILTRD